MSKVDMSTDLDVSSDKVWELIGGFNALPDWHPGIEKSELEEGGSIRRLTLVGGGEIVEKLEQVDDNEHVYTYSIVSSPLPIVNYVSTIRVKDEGDNKCSVEWSSEFQSPDENEAVQAIQGVYQTGFDQLKKIFGE